VHADGHDRRPVAVEQPFGQVGGQPKSLVVVHRPRLPGTGQEPAVLAACAAALLALATWRLRRALVG
jgi:hypothetical protein